MKKERDDKNPTRACPYCDVVQTIKIREERGDYHLCSVTNVMTPFIPFGVKGKKFKDRAESPRLEDSPMVSYGYSDSEDPMMGAPTRGRR